MNIKKINSFLIVLSMIFATEAYARFSVKPLKPDEGRDQSFRRMNSPRFLLPRENGYSGPVVRRGIPARGYGVSPRRPTIARPPSPFVHRGGPIQRHGTFQRGPGVGFPLATKGRSVRSNLTKSQLVAAALNDMGAAKKQILAPKPALKDKDGPKKQTRAPKPPAQPNLYWNATYVTNNGVVIKRTLKNIQVYNTGTPLIGDNLYYGKGRRVNGTLLTTPVHLSLKQSPQEFQKQVSKFGRINKIIP